MAQEENKKPDWDKIDMLFDKIDAVLEEGFSKNEMSFMDIEIVMLLVKEKLFEEKLRAYQQYFSEEGTQTEKTDAPADFYR